MMNVLHNARPYLYGAIFGTFLLRASESGGLWWVCALVWLAVIVQDIRRHA